MTRVARTWVTVILLVLAMAGVEAVRALTSHEGFGRLGPLLVLALAGLLVIAACVLFEDQRTSWRLLELGTGWTLLLLLPPLIESEWAAGHGFALARLEQHGWTAPAAVALVVASGVAVRVHHVGIALFKRPYE